MTRRRGFTLVEMLVALAVLIVALGVVTSVFSITTRTASQSAASADLQALARNMLYQIGEDLRYCNPAESVLVIAGREQPAALTDADQAAGVRFRVLTGDPSNVPANYDPRFATATDPNYSDPRADVLMFFSNRPTASAAPPSNPSNTQQSAYAAGARLAPIQVVYGHAHIDQPQSFGSGVFAFAGNPRSIESGQIAAQRWHLARRATILEAAANQSTFQNSNGLNGGTDWLLRCEPDGSSNPSKAGDVARFDLQQFLNSGGVVSPYGSLLFPYPTGNNPTAPPAAILNVLYRNGTETGRHIATVIERPPANLRYNLGVQFAAGCVWFQVEFLMPEDPRNGLAHPDPQQRNDMPRWVEVPNGQTYVFAPDTPLNRERIAATPVSGGRLGDYALIRSVALGGSTTDVSNRDIRVWPYAIRITIRLVDPNGRLNEPLVRSLVHRFD